MPWDAMTVPRSFFSNYFFKFLVLANYNIFVTLYMIPMVFNHVYNSVNFFCDYNSVKISEPNTIYLIGICFKYALLQLVLLQRIVVWIGVSDTRFIYLFASRE